MAHLPAALRVVGILLTAAAITFCSKSSPTEPVPSNRDSVDVISIQPPAGATLQAGAPVTFTATIAYHLANAPSGTIAIVIEDQAFKNLSSTVPQPKVTVAGSTGAVTITDHVVLPATGVTTVLVFFPLVPAGATSTETVREVSYPVAPAPSLGHARQRSVREVS